MTIRRLKEKGALEQLAEEMEEYSEPEYAPIKITTTPALTVTPAQVATPGQIATPAAQSKKIIISLMF